MGAPWFRPEEGGTVVAFFKRKTGLTELSPLIVFITHSSVVWVIAHNRLAIGAPTFCFCQTRTFLDRKE